MRVVPALRVMISTGILLLAFTVSEAQSFRRPPAPKHGRHAIKRSPASKKEVKIREPRVVEKAKKKQEAGEKKRDRDYKKYVKENRQRSLQIQSPEVRERMLQNRKNADINYKNRKKAIASRTKNAGRKYRQ